ncbi:lysine histidine transporter-like 7 [Primulina eburnea]|uniref:lysine histidine transporter-like 7 n=1 Tax=Primulina eburnea TaxID=1245227 RepID=UPI003C6C25CA
MIGEMAMGGGSARIAPVAEETGEVSRSRTESKTQQEFVIIVSETEPPRNEQDSWLPITESRKGNTSTVAFHLICSGIGVQPLLLPVAFSYLGWSGGILCLSVVFWWQLYTIWLLLNLHESASGIRYSRFLHLSTVAFGNKLGKLVAIFPTMYLSTGTCVLYIISGGNIMDQLHHALCGDDQLECEAKALKLSEWFLVFICSATLTALFFTNLNKLYRVSLIGSVTAVAYCSLLWVLSVSKGQLAHVSGDYSTMEVKPTDTGDRIQNVLNGIGIIALAFRGHNLVLEIQGTLPTSPTQPSRKPMWRGVTISYLLIAMCMYPLAMVGHWAYGSKVIVDGGILGAFTKFHQNHTSKYITGAIYFIILINYLCAFQIYAMPVFDKFEHIYTSKKNQPCPRWLRSAIKVSFGGLTYFVAMAFPFLPSLGALLGSIALPLTLVYPCFMWVAIKKPLPLSKMWCLNISVGSLGVVLSLMLFSAALSSLIVNGLDANFFKPRAFSLCQLIN